MTPPCPERYASSTPVLLETLWKSRCPTVNKRTATDDEQQAQVAYAVLR
jgi:hypothetical protein